MRKMIIMRGPQGVGKSALRAKLGLDRNALGADDIRLLLGAPELTANGGWGIPQENGGTVWAMFAKLAKERMERGEAIVLDATFVDSADLKHYVQLGESFGYEMALADFTGFPTERAIAQDAAREPMRRVGRKAIERTVAAFARSGFKASDYPGLRVEPWREEDGIDGLAQRLGKWLAVEPADLSAYSKVVHVGDLQGCWTVLAGPGAPFEHGFDPGVFYIFCGDLVDRGLENGKLVAWWRDVAMGKPNVKLMWGNHEDHLWRFAKGEAPVSREFERRTLPQLLAAGVSPKDAEAILSEAVDIFPYRWRGAQVVANHAGLTGLPPLDAQGAPQWHLISRHQVSKGAGNYSDPIDKAFCDAQAALAPELRWTQVHGHRNSGAGALEHPLSVNLEDSVERGGCLRWAELGESGWIAHERQNPVYASWRDRFARPAGAPAGEHGKSKEKEEGKGGEMGQGEEKEQAKDDTAFAFDVKAPIPAWITEAGSAPARLEPETLAKMRAHGGVMEKAMPDRPHIASLNFTRAVFFDKAWDEVVVKARGLFVDAESGDVAARGYDKFFNIGERPETEMSSLAKTLAFPVVGYLKENGFLGNLGYDARRGELMFASKSTTGGDFAAWFKEIFEASVPAAAREDIRRYLRDAEACMAFEVVDPVRDPHMIDYPKAKVVLLDVFHRSEDGRKLPYQDLRKAAAAFGLEAKGRMFEFKTMEALSGWIAKAYKDLSYRYAGADIEGVVFEDAKGFQTKCKMPHYGFWKSMRSAKDRIARLKDKIAEIDEACARNPKMVALKAQERANAAANLERAKKSDSHPMAVAFVEWCHAKPSSELAGASVIELRRQFGEQVGIDPAWMLAKWDRFDPTEKEEPPKDKKAKAGEGGGELSAGAPAAAQGAKPKM